MWRVWAPVLAWLVRVELGGLYQLSSLMQLCRFVCYSIEIFYYQGVLSVLGWLDAGPVLVGHSTVWLSPRQDRRKIRLVRPGDVPDGSDSGTSSVFIH